MIKLYQPYMGEDEKSSLPPGVIPWDASSNTDNSTREYELFKQISQANTGSSEPWGLISRKFTHKSLLSVNDFARFAEQKLSEGYDCVFINPMMGIEALYLNVWQQGVHCGHAGLEKIIDFLEKSLAIPFNAPMDRNTFAFCNYFIAKPEFWRAYFSFVDQALHLLDQEIIKNTEVGAAYTGTGSYHRDTNITMKPFIIERLFSTFIQNSQFKIASFSYSKNFYECKFGVKFGEFLFQLSALKNTGLELQQENLLAAYDQIRFFIYSNPTYMASLSLLDDPPDFFLSKEYAELMSQDFMAGAP
jgi:hypothetical protein